jgi:quercetin dioxygenase-like cupin family protein
MDSRDASSNQHGQILVRSPGTGQDIPLGDAGVVTLKAVGAETAGRLAAYEFGVPPTTAGPPLHLHRTWDEAFYVLEGEMTFLIAGEEHRAPAGSFIFIPRGVLHTFWNASDALTRQLTVFTPAGIEDYFAALTQLLTAENDAARAEATALMAQHDMVVPDDDRAAYRALGDG